METNFFGALWVSQAVLPHMRAQGSGHILQVSSIGGVNAFATIGLYHASKWALEGFSQSMAAEVAPLGIKVTIIEPAGYATDWSGPSAIQTTPIEAYSEARASRAAFRSVAIPGVPEASGPVILKLVDADNPPLRIFFGTAGLPMTKAEYAQRIETWEAWNDLSVEAQGDLQAKRDD
jgi:NAD(P)-dependent dehydrogenase (short-subunit alcohol dehydrogenase family)